ncbi:MAG: hypothetical protein ACK5ZY_08985 [Cyclobacteriaceae bacterium]|jgi:hypothetical protein
MDKVFEIYIREKLIKSKTDFLSKKNLHPLLEQFRTIVKDIDINDTASKFELEISTNIREWWTNKEKDVDTDVDLLAILFTYGSLDEFNSEALAYGICKSDLLLNTKPEPYLLDSHDYANGFYAMPGITLTLRESLNRLHWRNIDEENKEVEIYYLDGRHQLFDTFRHSIELALHYALRNLKDKGELVSLKMNKPFHFLLQEHDEKVRPILIVE